jgi:hypothetical protein
MNAYIQPVARISTTTSCMFNGSMVQSHAIDDSSHSLKIGERGFRTLEMLSSNADGFASVMMTKGRGETLECVSIILGIEELTALGDQIKAILNRYEAARDR